MNKKSIAGTLLLACALVVSCSSENKEQATTTPESETTLVSDEPEATEAEPEETAPEAESEVAAAAKPSWMPDGVNMLPSGLGIVVENAGDSQHATPTSRVTLHYRGRLTNGTVFDSSYDRGMAATFSATQVIPGFGEGIMQIGKGGKATLYIPSELGYGPQGTPGGPIGPNENLIFDIEIVDIN